MLDLTQVRDCLPDHGGRERRIGVGPDQIDFRFRILFRLPGNAGKECYQVPGKIPLLPHDFHGQIPEPVEDQAPRNLAVSL